MMPSQPVSQPVSPRAGSGSDLTSPGPIGGTTPGAGTFTDLTATTSFTANSGTTFTYGGSSAATHRTALELPDRTFTILAALGG